jgi:hypothetical protein
MDKVQLTDTTGNLITLSQDGSQPDTIPGISVLRYSRMPRYSTLQWTRVPPGFPGVSYLYFNTGVQVIGSSGVVQMHDSNGNWVVVSVDFAAATVSKTVMFDYALPNYPADQAYGLGPSPLSSLVFEGIARRVYNNPELGILLRQLNILDLGVGGQYIVPAKSELSKEALAPDSYICQALDQLLAFYDSRMTDE